MAVRRPFMPGGSSAPMVGGMPTQQPRPPMTMAPSPQGAAPAVAPGSGAPQPPPAPLPPPIQPAAGGPTSPLNIQQMLTAKMGAQGTPGAGTGQPSLTPLPKWGDSSGAGDPAGGAMRLGYQGGPDAGGGPGASPGGIDPAQLTDPSADDTKGGMSPLVMLRLLKHMGHV